MPVLFSDMTTTGTASQRAIDGGPSGSRRERTRERLMDAAFQAFADDGFAASSVETISDRAGFSRGAFYYNFDSKEQLFLAVMQRDIGRRIALLQRDAGSEEFFADLTDEDRVLTLMRGPAGGDDLKWVLVTMEFRLHAVRDVAANAAHDFDAQFRALNEGLAATFASGAQAAGVTFSVPAEMVAVLVVGVYMQAVIDGAVARLPLEEAQHLTAERVVAVLRGLIVQE